MTTTTKPPSYETLVGAGIALLKQNNLNAAQQLFEQAVKAAPTLPVAYYDLGVIDQEENNTRGALQEYLMANREDPKYVHALYNRAVIYRTLNKPLAEFLYRQVIQYQPDAPTALLALGLLEIGGKGSAVQSQAIGYLKQAVKLDRSLMADIPKKYRAEVRSTKTKSKTK
ncbi:MAG: tetratricopeptide repeat protein [Acidimicrobiales bacterium]